MQINRDTYLNRIVRKKHNGLIKVITGIRRCGKSYLLNTLFKNHLIGQGVPRDHIITIALDRISNQKFHKNPEAFDRYVRSMVADDSQYYLLLDEIQLVENFELVLNGFLYDGNLDVYVTGSNSKFLSSDIITEFRGRSDQIHLNPLSFSEFCQASDKDLYESWNDYLTFGGMPLILSKQDEEEKSKYLEDLFAHTYVRDIIQRNGIKRIDVLDSIINLLASSVGSLTNPKKICDTFRSQGERELSLNTVNSYLSCIEDSFIVSKALRYDVKGRKYINTPQKYYFTDLGLRNARLKFRQQEQSHLMENAIYNELMFRGYSVDVGVVEIRDQGRHVQTEVDFVCNMGSERFYIQSALNLDTIEKTEQESRPLNQIRDSFRKIIVVKDRIKPWRTQSGIRVMGVVDFLTDPDSLIR